MIEYKGMSAGGPDDDHETLGDLFYEACGEELINEMDEWDHHYSTYYDTGPGSQE